MKNYKVISERIVFAVEEKQYALKKGDVVELNEKDITTCALVYKNRIVEVESTEQILEIAKEDETAVLPNSNSEVSNEDKPVKKKASK